MVGWQVLHAAEPTYVGAAPTVRVATKALKQRNVRNCIRHPVSIYFSLVSLVGWDCSQAMESVTPEAMAAQALVMAVRVANSSVDPDAVRQLVWPRKVMQAS